MTRTRTPVIVIVAFVALVAFIARGTDGPVERSSASLAPGEQIVTDLGLTETTPPGIDYAG
jgi:hypothetical protein